MIAPDMATMLAFVFTDAKVPSGVLQKLVTDAADKSLNCVTIDGDTSTSDTLLVVATGAARHAPIEEADDPVLVDFKRALDEVLIDLAQLLARDGEGATKFVTIYDETPVVKHIKGTDIVIDIDLGIGRGRATVWTCDLTHGYIDINGSYRT